MAGGGQGVVSQVSGATNNQGSGQTYGGTPIGNAYAQQPQQMMQPSSGYAGNSNGGYQQPMQYPPNYGQLQQQGGGITSLVNGGTNSFGGGQGDQDFIVHGHPMNQQSGLGSLVQPMQTDVLYQQQLPGAPTSSNPYTLQPGFIG